MTPEFLEDTPSPALPSFSSTITDCPFSEIALAIDNPITPAPIITTSKIFILQKLCFVYMPKLYKIQLLFAQIAQSVEQRTENPCVGGSIPPLGTIS